MGPSKFQWTKKQIFYAQTLLDLLPDKLKVDCSIGEKNLKCRIERRKPRDIEREDPSEAIRSDEIIGILKKHFQIIEQKPLGGTVLNLLFDRIAKNFNEEDPCIRSLILSFQKIEEILILEEILPSDFTFLVLKKQSAKK